MQAVGERQAAQGGVADVWLVSGKWSKTKRGAAGEYMLRREAETAWGRHVTDVPGGGGDQRERARAAMSQSLYALVRCGDAFVVVRRRAQAGNQTKAWCRCAPVAGAATTTQTVVMRRTDGDGGAVRARAAGEGWGGLAGGSRGRCLLDGGAARLREAWAGRGRGMGLGGMGEGGGGASNVRDPEQARVDWKRSGKEHRRTRGANCRRGRSAL